MEDKKPGVEGSPDERRDSGRVPIRLMVRDLGLGGSFDERPGNLSLGGAYFTEGHPPVGTRVELRFILPGAGEIRATGEVLRVTREGGVFGTHVRFLDLPVEAELTIARFLEGH
jgi:hypothetical protein